MTESELRYDLFESPESSAVPVRAWLAVALEGKLLLLHMLSEKERAEGSRWLRRHPEAMLDPAAPPLPAARRQLIEYIHGERQTFDLPLAPSGTEFQRQVWRALVDIPFGETRSYGELARQLGRPDASRAVGAANGDNPIAVVIPCHRVIGSDGSLTGYGGGLPMKKFLLELENALPEERRRKKKRTEQMALPI